MSQIERIKQAIMADPQNASYTERGIEPLFAAPKLLASISSVRHLDLKPKKQDFTGRIKVVIACGTGWVWMKIPLQFRLFCSSAHGFLLSGHGKSGDLPPSTGFAEKWHPQLLQELPDIQLTLLIGQYAQAYYLHEKLVARVTERVKHYQNYLANYFSIGSPSPRNQIWMAKNPWFESEVVPDLKKELKPF